MNVFPNVKVKKKPCYLSGSKINWGQFFKEYSVFQRIFSMN